VNPIVGAFQTIDGLKLYTETWEPTQPPKAAVLIAHGHAEHIGRYEFLIRYLVEAGFVVYGLDHRGHGRSEGLRIHFDTIDQPLSDLKQLVDSIKSRGLPIFLFGHSMGSIISLMYALRYPADLAGLVISGTAVHAHHNTPQFIITLGRMVHNLMPRARVIQVAESAADLTRDEAVIEAVKHDPLMENGNMRLGMAACLILASETISEQVGELSLPLLILHGEADTVTPVSGAQYIYDHATSADKTLKIYPEMRHEPHQEIDREIVFDDLVNWLVAHS